MADKTATQSGFDIGKFLQLFQLLKPIIDAVKDILPKKKPTAPVTTPTPVEIPDDSDFPDDIIPVPVPKGRKVATVTCKLSRIQLSRQRFPESYNSDNPFGLMKPGPVQAGDNMPWASKFWLDLTARDKDGKEFLREDILAAGIEFKTEHHAGDTFIKGHGGTGDNLANPGYETNDTEQIGNGITAWLSSNGFLHQMKAFGTGSFDCYGVVDGVESNHFTLNVK